MQKFVTHFNSHRGSAALYMFDLKGLSTYLKKMEFKKNFFAASFHSRCQFDVDVVNWFWSALQWDGKETIFTYSQLLSKSDGIDAKDFEKALNDWSGSPTHLLLEASEAGNLKLLNDWHPSKASPVPLSIFPPGQKLIRKLPHHDDDKLFLRVKG